MIGVVVLKGGAAPSLFMEKMTTELQFPQIPDSRGGELHCFPGQTWPELASPERREKGYRGSVLYIQGTRAIREELREPVAVPVHSHHGERTVLDLSLLELPAETEFEEGRLCTFRLKPERLWPA